MKIEDYFMLKSAYHSARIEGNDLSWEEVVEVFLKEKIKSLLPRRSKIYELIETNKLTNFEQIKRKFLKVNERTLRYDLKKLQEQGLIRKLGTTRGVYYQIK